MIAPSMLKNSLLLALFALITAAVLASTFLLTREQINQSERAAAQRALFEILPPESHTNDLLNDTRPIPDELRKVLNVDPDQAVHVARRDGEITAVIVRTVAPDGYSGDIVMLAGLHRDGQLAGVRVLSHRETPGLGDKVELEKSDWILGFAGRSLGDPPAEDWRVKKDGGHFDQFTGATITPRAVVRQLRRTLEAMQEHRQALFAEPDFAESDFAETESAEPDSDTGQETNHE